MRRRVKEQLKKLGGMEFYDVNFSYIDLDDQVLPGNGKIERTGLGSDSKYLFCGFRKCSG